ncbi:hypothetical protein D9757_004737 [Collybiopsis confluens]|uniref:Uncharacterized protein n=1 Tax=Collybiopsis confluens TaxID=2823264 RepID=A0A8H5MBR9_9AGAR|nr:hypothetical protein D9757_004737 [Collybiopsis confluens]
MQDACPRSHQPRRRITFSEGIPLLGTGTSSAFLPIDTVLHARTYLILADFAGTGWQVMNLTTAQQISAAGQEKLLSSILDSFLVLGPSSDHLYFSFHVLTYPVRATTVFFFLNRYFAILGNIVVTVSLFATNLTESVDLLFHSRSSLILIFSNIELWALPYIPRAIASRDASHSLRYDPSYEPIPKCPNPERIPALLTIRIYALYHCSKRVLVGMVSTGLVLIALSIFSIFFGQSSQSEVTLVGCHTQLSFITSVQVAAAWEALFVYDSMLFVMILYRGYKTRHELRQQKIPLLLIILRDGSLYFGVMALANAINISTFYYPLWGRKVAAAWEALFVYDSILFVMILHRGYKTRHQLRRQKIPLLVIILRDGSLYFGVMALANAINISTFYYPLLYIRGVLCTFTSSLSVTLISRIMLNLHKIADSGLYTPYITTLQLDSENYSTFLAPPPSDRTVTREA